MTCVKKSLMVDLHTAVFRTSASSVNVDVSDIEDEESEHAGEVLEMRSASTLNAGDVGDGGLGKGTRLRGGAGKGSRSNGPRVGE